MIIPHMILGGGLAGLTIATELLKTKKDFVLVESSQRLGGKIRTKLNQEACLEYGPNSFSNQSLEIFDLLEALNLSEDVIKASSVSQNRYILKNGKLTCLPGKPQEILTTKALSFWGRIRFLSEFFHVPRKKKEEESVWDFFTRHFGAEVSNYFADPFVSGIFAGNAKELALKESFPTMAEAEAQSSSLIRYLMASRKTTKATPQSFQLKHGLESIFHRAKEKIGEDKIRLGEKAIEVIPEDQLIRVVTDKAEYQVKQLYITIPAYGAAEIFKKSFPELSKTLSQIDYAPVITAHLRVKKEEAFQFNGFGILIPALENRKILGTLWNSSTFPSLFGDQKHHYITVFLGGSRDRALTQNDDATIAQIIFQEVLKLFQLQNHPSLMEINRHAKAIPQYTLGYGKILNSLHQSLTRYPSLKLAGNYLGGISMPKTVAYALKVMGALKPAPAEDVDKK